MNPIAFLFMIIAAAAMTPLLFGAIASQGAQEKDMVTAMQMAQINKAAQEYITANAETIEGVATATSPYTISVATLVNNGYLPAGFSANNPYGQTWEVQVLSPQANQLQALVVSTSPQNQNLIDAKQAGAIIMAAGNTGGIVGGGTGDFYEPHCPNGDACGVYQGWSVPTNGYNVSPGDLVSLIDYSNGQVQNNDYLYRTAVPGQPQLNTMDTSLNMGTNNIADAGNVTADATSVSQNATVGETDSPSAVTALPSGWKGIYVDNEYAKGSISTGDGSYDATYMDGSGNVGVIVAQDKSTGDYVTINSDPQNTGQTGSDSTIRTTGNIEANGNIYTYGHIHFAQTPGSGAVEPGYQCTTPGTLTGSRYNNGTLMVCSDNSRYGDVWESLVGDTPTEETAPPNDPNPYPIPGTWGMCVLQSGGSSGGSVLLNYRNQWVISGTGTVAYCYN